MGPGRWRATLFGTVQYGWYDLGSGDCERARLIVFVWLPVISCSAVPCDVGLGLGLVSPPTGRLRT